MRAAAINGYASVTMLSNVHGLCDSDGDGWINAAFTRPSRYRQITLRMGLSSDIESLAFRRIGPTTHSSRDFDGIAIPESLFRPDGHTYCPICLDERPFWRRLWLLRPVTACPAHELFLHSKCPNCAQPLEPTRGDLLRCKCGYDLRESPTEAVDAGPVQWLKACMENGDADKVGAALSFWKQLCDFGGASHTPEGALAYLAQSQKWAEGDRSPSPDLVDVLQQRSVTVHPRLQILPFLRGNDTSAAFGIAMVAAIERGAASVHKELEGSITSTDAARVLGVGAAQVRALREVGILSPGVSGNCGRRSVTCTSVNALLINLDAPVARPDRCIAIGRTTSLSSIIQRVLTGEFASGGFDRTTGLRSLRYLPVHPAPPVQCASALNVHEVAQKLGVHPEIVRSMARKGHLKRLASKNARAPLLVSPGEVDRFNNAYVTGGALARSLNVNATNFAEKLRYVGVQPVAGPGIDGMLVYLFKRKDLSPSVLKKALELDTYATVTGRPKRGAYPKHAPGISVAEASRRLGVGSQKVITLIRSGTIGTILCSCRGPRIDRLSLARLERMLRSPQYVPVAECAARLGCSVRQVDTVWAASGSCGVCMRRSNSCSIAGGISRTGAAEAAWTCGGWTLLAAPSPASAAPAPVSLTKSRRETCIKGSYLR